MLLYSMLCYGLILCLVVFLSDASDMHATVLTSGIHCFHEAYSYVLRHDHAALC